MREELRKEWKKIASEPIFFERNRVFRVYLGGKLFSDFFGDKPEDGNMPEEWIASGVRAINRSSSDPHEGISRVRGTDIYLDELLSECREEILGESESFGILVKVLDSAVRLPMQAHPDKEYSRRYFNSGYGKAEMWLILAARGDTKIFFGFKDKISKEEFAEAVEKSETDKLIMEQIANEISVKPGDVYFIPAKTVHAIGAGCLILEIQEPTDFTIKPEYWCDEYHLNEREMYLGLSKDEALECFDYEKFGEKVLKSAEKIPKLLIETDKLKKEQLVGAEDTPCFSVMRYYLGGGECPLETAPSVHIVINGNGYLTNGEKSISLKKGDYFLLPKAAECWRIESQEVIEWVECIPPKE